MRKLFIPVVVLVFAACEDPLTPTPESILTPEQFYGTASDMDAAVAAAYAPLTDNIHAFGRNLWNILDAGSDEAISNPAVPSAVAQAFGLMNFAPDQERIMSPWFRLYRTITRANIVVDRTPEIDASDERKAALIGEAKFLRAFAYSYLVRLWGDVPLVVREEDALQSDIARSSTEDVYDLILQDAQDAVQSLPERWDDANSGRATRGAALALMADMALTRGEWQQAADVAKQIIDSGHYDLLPDFSDNFVPAYNNGIESVFALQVSSEPGVPGSRFVDMYFPREIGAGRGGGWAWFLPNQWQIDSFIEDDYRKDVTYETNFLNVITGEWLTVPAPHVHKFRPTEVINSNEGDVNIPIYRFAEVLLIYAEAANELGRPAEAVEYVNMVRARARNADGAERAEPAAYQGPVEQGAVHEIIFQERRWELAHEAKRWFDLVRRGEDYFMSQLQQNDPQAQPAPHKMLLPLPQSEIDQNPALVQNPGY